MKFLVALDESLQALKVLEKVAALAKAEKPEVTILLVSEEFVDVGDVLAAPHLNEKVLEGVKEAAERYKVRAQELGLNFKIVIESGTSPEDLIIKYAEDKKCDLIVLGSRGRKGFSRFLIGSVASRVVTHASCSVLVVR